MASFFNKTEIGASTPHASEVAEAKRFANAHVYRIAGHFGANDAVPPAAIIGAWKVDAQGRIIGQFIKNPNYDPKRWPIRKNAFG